MRMTTTQRRDTRDTIGAGALGARAAPLVAWARTPCLHGSWAGSPCHMVPVSFSAHDEPARPDPPPRRVRRADGARVAGRAHDAGVAIQGGRQAGDAVAGAVRAVRLHADRGAPGVSASSR